MKCSFCGHEFDERAGAQACASCPMSRSCGKISCPSCGFEMPKPVKFGLAERIKSLFKGSSPQDAARTVPGIVTASRPGGCAACPTPCSLASVAPGQSAEIVAVDTTDQKRLKRLLALGVLPGTRVQVTQTYPSYVFRAGHTTVAVDEGTARGITVSPVVAD